MLEIITTYHQESCVLSIFLNGTLDISTVHKFDEMVNKIDGINLLIIDFSNLEFIDSTGIGALLEFILKARNIGMQVEFQGLKEYINEIFETVGLIRILKAIQKNINM